MTEYHENTGAGETRRLLQQLMALYPDPHGTAGPHVVFDPEQKNYRIDFAQHIMRPRANISVPSPNTLKWRDEVIECLQDLEIGQIGKDRAAGNAENPHPIDLKPDLGRLDAETINKKLKQAIITRSEQLTLDEGLSRDDPRLLREALLQLARCFMHKEDEDSVHAAQGEGGQAVLTYTKEDMPYNMRAISQLVHALNSEGLVSSPRPGKPLMALEDNPHEPPSLPFNIGYNLVLDTDDNGALRLSFTPPLSVDVNSVLARLEQASIENLRNDESYREPEWIGGLKKKEKIPYNPMDASLAMWCERQKSRPLIRQQDPVKEYLEEAFAQITGRVVEAQYVADMKMYCIDPDMSTKKYSERMDVLTGGLKKKANRLEALSEIKLVRKKDEKTGNNDICIIEIKADDPEQLLAHIKQADPEYFKSIDTPHR